MTPLPKRRWSTRRQGKKRATLRLVSSGKSVCKSCGEPKVSHRVCPKCGLYNGLQVIKVKQKKVKKAVEN